MKKIIISSILISILLLACRNVPTNNTIKEEIHNDNLVEADLFFGWLRMGSFYGNSDAKNIDINAALEAMSKNNTSTDSSLIVLYKKLNERDLIFSPYVDVKLEDGSSATWYLNQLDYDSLKTFKLDDLTATKSKVHLSAEIEHIYQNAYLCKNLAKIELVKDVNYNNTDKFNAGDYK